MLTPLPIEGFGGLNLVDDPLEVGWSGAIDALNVDFAPNGRVMQRRGSFKFTSAAGATAYTYMTIHQPDHPSGLMVAGRTGNVDALNQSGGVAATAAYGSLSHGATFGAPSGTRTYLAHTRTLTMRSFDGTNFAAPTATVDGVAGRAMPITTYVGSTPWDNRLVAAYGSSTGGPNGTTSSGSHVHFSDPGAAETWQSSSYIQLTPGDGEDIVAVVTWRELLFVFKRSKFFVFYGTSTSSTGTPVFNYHAIDTGVGADTPSSGLTYTDLAVAAPDGVYFVGQHGIYRTTGGPPEIVSSALTPVFRSNTQGLDWTYFTGGQTPRSGIAYTNGQILAWRNTAAASRAYVLDIETGRWTYWTFGFTLTHFVGWMKGDAGVFHYGRSTVSNDIMRMPFSASDDDGTAISSLYRTGFATPGGPGAEATIRETVLTGIGTVSAAWSREMAADPGTPLAVTLGTTTAARGNHRVATRGEALSLQLSGSSAWQVNRVVPMLREVRSIGQRTS